MPAGVLTCVETSSTHHADAGGDAIVREEHSFRCHLIKPRRVDELISRSTLFHTFTITQRKKREHAIVRVRQVQSQADRQ